MSLKYLFIFLMKKKKRVERWWLSFHFKPDILFEFLSLVLKNKIRGQNSVENLKTNNICHFISL